MGEQSEKKPAHTQLVYVVFLHRQHTHQPSSKLATLARLETQSQWQWRQETRTSVI